jgi:hypothetical protein
VKEEQRKEPLERMEEVVKKKQPEKKGEEEEDWKVKKAKHLLRRVEMSQHIVHGATFVPTF